MPALDPASSAAAAVAGAERGVKRDQRRLGGDCLAQDRAEQAAGVEGSAPGHPRCGRQALLPPGDLSSLPLTGLSTLGSGPARFPTKSACYRTSWQLPGPDFQRRATTSLRTARSAATSQRRLPLRWAHERSRLVPKA
jgi:hypothetical protein